MRNVLANKPKPQASRRAPRRKPKKFFLEERRRQVLELVDAQERVTVEELASRFGVSAVTVRGDLDALAEAGAVLRSHGGALRRKEGDDIPIAVKASLHHPEKVRIAQAAVRMLADGETIILDSGTTTEEIARQIRFLPFTSLNVITNALNIAMDLASLPHVRLIMLGGMLRHRSFSLAGPQAEQALRGLYADRLFLGVDGIDPELGLMTPDVLESQLNALMIQASREVVAVTDSSKFQRRSLSVIGGVDKLHKLITDSQASPDVVAAVRARGVEVLLV